MRSRGKSIRCEEIRMEWLLFLVRDFLGGGVGFLAPGATAAPLKSPTYGRIWKINLDSKFFGEEKPNICK